MKVLDKKLFYLTALGSCMTTSLFADTNRPAKPNVLFILTDDLGWQDVKCYDIDEPSPYETPNIDRLATQGVMFTQAYSPAPTSSPSRGAIMSGRHPARLQRTHVVGGSPILPNNENASRLMSPWYSGRLDVSEVIIPEMIKKRGYYSGHIGKWHMAIDHTAFPQPLDQGFDFSISDRGVTDPMRPDRLKDFATNNPDDPYRLDENGMPRDRNNENALQFLKDNKDKPFFLYYATWLVHAPIQTRCKALLEKYCKKMNVPFPQNPKGWKYEGQRNPYYGAMVEMMDYYVGQIINYLKETEDPRWKGHKLIENTYIIFTSDNGGMEGSRDEVYTDNAPLDKGKIYVQEGGIRVPMIISGPGIKKNVKSDVLVSGLDIFPTIMSWTNTPIDKNHVLDGCDLSQLLTKNPTDAGMVKNRKGEARNHIIHHFPHNMMQSSIIMDGYKLVKNYDSSKEKFELFQLYANGGKRIDIEEKKEISAGHKELVRKMGVTLNRELAEMKAQTPYKNPLCTFYKSKKYVPCTVTGENINGQKVELKFKQGQNPVKKVLLLYTKNGNKKHEEWFEMHAKVNADGSAVATLPKGTTHYVWSIVDKEDFLINYPNMGDLRKYKKGNYAVKALSVK